MSNKIYLDVDNHSDNLNAESDMPAAAIEHTNDISETTLGGRIRSKKIMTESSGDHLNNNEQATTRQALIRARAQLQQILKERKKREQSRPPDLKSNTDTEILVAKAGYSSVEQLTEREDYPPEGTPAHDIATGKLSLETVEVGDSAGMFRLISDAAYEKKTAEEKNILDRRLAALSERDVRPVTGEPRATVAIPVAIHNERPDTVRRSLDLIAKTRGIDQDEIIVYGNMPEGLSDVEKRKARADFDAMITAFRTAHPDIMIRTIAEEYPDDILTITQVRNDMFDLIARDGAQRGFRFDHPVIMLDADILFIGKNTNEVLASVLTAPDSREIIANAFSRYQFDMPSSPDNLEDIHELDDARKLAIVAELAYRIQIRNTIREYGGVPYIHPQENGMVIALGPSIMVGNFGKRGETDNEAVGLIKNIESSEPELTLALQKAKPEVVGERPLWPQYHEGAVVGTSARRWEKVLQEWVTLPEGADDSVYEKNVSGWRFTGPSGEYSSDSFSHTDEIRVQVSQGQYNAPNEARLQRIVDSMFDGRYLRVPREDIIPLLKKYHLPLPTSWKAQETAND